MFKNQRNLKKALFWFCSQLYANWIIKKYCHNKVIRSDVFIRTKTWFRILFHFIIPPTLLFASGYEFAPLPSRKIDLIEVGIECLDSMSRPISFDPNARTRGYFTTRFPFDTSTLNTMQKYVKMRLTYKRIGWQQSKATTTSFSSDILNFLANTFWVEDGVKKNISMRENWLLKMHE